MARKRAPHFFQKVLAAFLGLFGILSILLVVFRLNETQDIRRSASTSSDVEVKLQAKDVSSNSMKVQVLINTGANAVAGVELKGSVSGVSAEKISWDTTTSLPLETVTAKITSGSPPSFHLVQFGSIDPSKPVNTQGQDVVVATLTIQRENATTIDVRFDKSGSDVPVLNKASTGVSFQEKSFSFSSNTTTTTTNEVKKDCNQNCATDTECKGQFICYKGRCRLPDDREDEKCEGTPDQGIHRSCNEYCADTRECKQGLTCYYNKCRNPQNVQSESCQAPVARVQTSTQTSRRTPAPVVTPSPVVVVELTFDPTPTPSPSPSPTPSPRIVPTPTVTPRPVAEKEASVESSRGGFPTWLLSLLGVVLIGGSIGGWYFLNRQSR